MYWGRHCSHSVCTAEDLIGSLFCIGGVCVYIYENINIYYIYLYIYIYFTIMPGIRKKNYPQSGFNKVLEDRVT